MDLLIGGIQDSIEMEASWLTNWTTCVTPEWKKNNSVGKQIEIGQDWGQVKVTKGYC